MRKEKLEWKRMVEGKLYNATSKDIFWQHARGLWLTQKLNKCSVLNQPRQKRLFNKLIPSSKGKSVWAFTPFYCEYGVNINVGNGVFSITVAPFSIYLPSLWRTESGWVQTSRSQRRVIRFWHTRG